MIVSRKRILHFLLSLSFLTASVGQANPEAFVASDAQAREALTQDNIPERDGASDLQSGLDSHDIKRLNRLADKADNKRLYTSTKHSDIVRWVDLRGGQYVMGYGIDPDTREEVPFAIYDKTFPRPVYPRYWRSLLLGTLGVGNLTLGHLANSFEKHSKHKRQEKAGRYVYEMLFEEKGENNFPADFWKSKDLHWVKGKAPNLRGPAPDRIDMADLDFEVGSDTILEFRHKLRNLFVHFHAVLHDEEGIEKGNPRNAKETQEIHRKHLVYDGTFVRQSDGTYTLELARESHNLPPTKVIDLRGNLSSLPRSLAWGMMVQGVKQGINYLPIPVVAQVGWVAAERFFNLVEITYLTRHAMALNMIMEAIDENPASPFYGVLAPNELNDAITYLRRSSTMISDMIYNIFSNKWTVAQKYLKGAEKARTRSLQYLEDHHYSVYPFAHSYYALGVKRNSAGEVMVLKVFSLIKNKLFRKKPHDVVDFVHPKRETVKRHVFESILIGTGFVTVPIPAVVSLIRLFYKELFIREIHRRQMAEAGFRSHMNHNHRDLIEALVKEGYSHSAARKMVDTAYDVILKREMNPVEISHEDESEYTRRVEGWIKSKDSSYDPIMMDYNY